MKSPLRSFLVLLLFTSTVLNAAESTTTTRPSETINITTARSQLKLSVGEDGRLYQAGYGTAARDIAVTNRPQREFEFYPQYGNGYIHEPALQATHADGNTSTDLVYVKHEATQVGPNVTLTKIELKDPAYPFYVTLFLKAYGNEDVIEQWSEVRHDENGNVTLYRFASSSPQFRSRDYWLTQFHGDYKREATLAEEKLTPGLKVLDSKIAVRAHRFRMPSFLVSLDNAADENSGEVFGGSLKWAGSFQLAFDLDSRNRMRALVGMNPFGEHYVLKKSVVFRTPGVLWTWSNQGKGQVSRNFHRWALKYGIRDGEKPRPVLLNNWEATGVKFDEKIIASLFDGAKEIGADTFLLDDGWFGNNHPRNNDRAGLGDWQADKKKLPNGVSSLAQQAVRKGIKFGIWIEPEMVNPQSDLYEKHPDWILRQPKREPDADRGARYQLVLDLSRPEVKDFAWKVVEDVLSEPGVSYVKWDANRYVTQPGSPYLPSDLQSHVLIDYNWGLFDVMERMANKFPQIMAMACAGGGGRVDYGTMKYFHSFWPSDNTDPVGRVKIQWGFGHFFPAAAISAHVTRMGNRPLKFTTDVAMSGALGVDMDVRKLSAEDRKAIAASVAMYNRELRNLVEQGDLYRLDSPYDGPRAALSYIAADRSQAVIYVYQMKTAGSQAVKLRGLDPEKRYRVREVNLPEGTFSKLAKDNQVVDGATLMREGLVPACEKEFDSAVIKLTAER